MDSASRAARRPDGVSSPSASWMPHTGGFDPATEDLAITALADEEEHRREFMGFLKEIERGRLG